LDSLTSEERIANYKPGVDTDPKLPKKRPLYPWMVSRER